MHDDAAFFDWCAQTTHTESPLIQPLAVEASHRRFYRVLANANDTSSWVAMNSPPTLEQNDQFVALAEIFAQHNIPVPNILATDLSRGFVLMTDLGAIELAHTYGTTTEQPALTAAISVLIQLQEVASEHIPVYDQARLAMEFDLFEEWLLRKFLGSPGVAVATSGANTLTTVKALCLDTMLEQPQTCVHRDYHCRNLLFNHNQLGVVDFQDALIGPGLYDIASLLRDCYYRHNEAQVDHYLGLFLQRSPYFDAAQFASLKRAFDLTAIQRQLKALGIFARLHLRDGKSSHLIWIEPVLHRLIEVARTHSETQPLSLLLDQLRQPIAERLAALQ